jgi:hypothetical protein
MVVPLRRLPEGEFAIARPDKLSREFRGYPDPLFNKRISGDGQICGAVNGIDRFFWLIAASAQPDYRQQQHKRVWDSRSIELLENGSRWINVAFVAHPEFSRQWVAGAWYAPQLTGNSDLAQTYAEVERKSGMIAQDSVKRSPGPLEIPAADHRLFGATPILVDRDVILPRNRQLERKHRIKIGLATGDLELGEVRHRHQR